MVEYTPVDVITTASPPLSYSTLLTGEPSETDAENPKIQGACGFLASDGKFVDRFEAYAIQTAAGRSSVAADGYRGLELYSEDLY